MASITQANRYRLQAENVRVTDYNAPGVANTAAVVYIPSASLVAHVITAVDFSYAGTGALSGGSITIADGSTTIWSMGISNYDAYTKFFDPPLRITPGNGATITLTAGGSAATGTLAVQRYLEPWYQAVGMATDFSLSSNSGYLALV